MNWRLVIRLAAERDIAAISGWYDDQGDELGRAFLRAVDARLDDIRQNPFQYQVVYNGVRAAMLEGFS